MLTYMSYIHVIIIDKNEAINLNESKEEYMVGFIGRKITNLKKMAKKMQLS